MNNTQLETLYRNLLQEHFPRKSYDLRAFFYPGRSLRHTVELKKNVLTIRISQTLQTAPENILRVLGLIMLLKIFRYRANRELNRAYRQYIREHIIPQHETRHRSPSQRYTHAGKYYNLNKLFDKINQVYFKGQLKRPLIGWSLNPSYRRIGFYVREKDLLVISRIFDSKKVPQEIVEFLLFHEMLHIAIPVSEKNGRRRIHPPEFLQREKMFPNYDNIQRWLKKNIRRL